MNAKHLETATKEWPCDKKRILYITGPCSSGKTTLAQAVLRDKGFRHVTELSGFDTDISRTLAQIKINVSVKTVAEYAGLSYNNKPDALLIEDVEFCDASSVKYISSYVAVPIVCTCSASPNLSIVGVSCHIRLMRPPPKLAAEILVKEFQIPLQYAAKLVDRCDCDLRQAKNELALVKTTGVDRDVSESGTDRERPNPYVAVSMLFQPKSDLQSLLTITDDNDPLLSMMVAENYAKLKGLDPKTTALIAEDVSHGDIYHRKEPSVSTLFGSICPAVKGRSKQFATRPVYPSIVSHSAKRKKRVLPAGIDYTTIGAVERRIVQTLADGIPPAMVAREMHSMGLTKIEQWDYVRNTAKIGAQIVKVPFTKRAELQSALSLQQ